MRGQQAKQVGEWSRLFSERMQGMIERSRDELVHHEAILSLYNPERQLSFGYSIARIRGKIVRSVRDARAGDPLEVAVADGMIETEVINKTAYGQNKHQ